MSEFKPGTVLGLDGKPAFLIPFAFRLFVPSLFDAAAAYHLLPDDDLFKAGLAIRTKPKS